MCFTARRNDGQEYDAVRALVSGSKGQDRIYDRPRDGLSSGIPFSRHGSEMPFSLRQARVTFTGKLASLSRKEACQIVYDGGGEVTPSVSRRTSLVVVGMEGWPLLPDGMISSKLKRAEELMKR